MADSESEINVDKIATETADVDEDAVRKEHEFLERSAKSPAYRAEASHAQHIKAIEAERDRLVGQGTRDREIIEFLKPRVWELEQSQRTAKMNGGVGAIATALGGASLSVASFYGPHWHKWLWFSCGVTLTVIGVFLAVILRICNWPPDRSNPV